MLKLKLNFTGAKRNCRQVNAVAAHAQRVRPFGPKMSWLQRLPCERQEAFDNYDVTESKRPPSG